jgi:hypothetical protein
MPTLDNSIDHGATFFPNAHRLSTISSRVASLGHFSHLPHDYLTQHNASRRTSLCTGAALAHKARRQNLPGSQADLGERTSSKLTLDEELYDILFAFGFG